MATDRAESGNLKEGPGQTPECEPEAAATPDHRSAGELPLTRLVIELIEVVDTSEPLVSSVDVYQDFPVAKWGTERNTGAARSGLAEPDLRRSAGRQAVLFRPDAGRQKRTGGKPLNRLFRWTA
jgi:hypothetical protein